MFTQKNIWLISSGIFPKSTYITSSSPAPSPVRLSPLCVMPHSSVLPKKTAPTSLPSLEKHTAETSRSTPLPETSQPNLAEIWPSSFEAGKSMTSPLSIAKATFCRFGAEGITARIISPRVGSKMSMKCLPSWAGISRTRVSNSPAPLRTIDMTMSTSLLLFCNAYLRVSLLLESSRIWTVPLAASRRCPRPYAATMNIIMDTV
mmetsp:Transcript_17734/g.32102  ORF Transcript_17734/g.32102 Transcript_17734/m.32102 type:complete len:204 (-) Transcript_17734:41-652(-)